MERHYHFAGVDLSISMPEDRFYEHERRLAPFAVDAVADPHIFRFEIVDELTPPAGDCLTRQPMFRVYGDGQQQVRYIGLENERHKLGHIRACHRGKAHDIQLLAGSYPGRISARTVLNSIEAEHLIARNGGFIFHCSYIDCGGSAILFTAPSETGKSTQAELWKTLRGAQIINGDRAAVRVVDGKAIAEGIPFAGSSNDCLNRSLPIAAVVYLGQAPVTSIRRMRGYEAFVRLWEGCSVNTWDKEDVELVSAAVKHLAETVPVYHLPCTPDESAVIALENELKKQVNL